MTAVYLYTVEERLWHWAQALIMLVLMGTGAVIHWPQALPALSFETATRLHEWLGLLLAVNALFGLTYHVFSRQFGQFLPWGRTWTGMAVEQVRYYVWGIFRGAPHPMEKSVDRKLNPLQQLTYLGILNVMLPLQIVTGVIIFGARWLPALEPIADLSVLAPLHMVGAWMFVVFLFVHVYLTTTGHTPLSNLRAMITGFEEIDGPHQEDPP